MGGGDRTDQSREVVDGDDGTSLAYAFGVDFNGRRGEGCVYVVNRNGVVGVGGAARISVVRLE